MTPTGSARGTTRFAGRFGLGAVVAFAALVAFALVLLLVELKWAPLHRVDVRVDEDLNGTAVRHRASVTFWKGVSLVGQPITFEALSVIAGTVFWVRGRRRLALFTPVTVLGGVLLNTVAKALVDRARPVVSDPVATARGTSFPSGHAMASWVAMATLVVLVALLARRALVPTVVVGFLVAATIGFSRLALGVHYPSDVLGAWLLGTAWVAGCTLAFRVAADQAAGSQSVRRAKRADSFGSAST